MGSSPAGRTIPINKINNLIMVWRKIGVIQFLSTDIKK